MGKRLDGAGQASRRSVPIGAYVGANGGGKSLAMVHDTLPTLAGMTWRCEVETHRHTQDGQTSGLRTVLSTVPLLDHETGEPHPLYRKLVSWRQLIAAEHCDLLLDEVTGVCSSRSSANLPPQLANMLVQLRRRDVVLRYTTPNWARTEVIVREVTQAVTVCKGFMYQQADGLLWPQKRLFRWATYDAVDWEEMSLAKVAKTKPLKIAWYWRPGKAAMLSYDTREAVSTLDHVSEAGLCIECGGSRVRPKCSCLPVDDRPAGAAQGRRPGAERPHPHVVELVAR